MLHPLWQLSPDLVRKERPDSFFRQGYTRRNKDVAIIPPLISYAHPNTPLNDTTMPSDDSSKTNLEVYSSQPSLFPKTYILSPHVEDQGRRFPPRDRKASDRFGYSLDRFGFSNSVYPISDSVSYHRPSKTRLSFALQLSSVPIPSHFQEALEDPKWKSAMVDEMKALQKNSTWEMVKLPKDKKTVGCKWVFSVKYKSNGITNRYKAILVAKGYT